MKTYEPVSSLKLLKLFSEIQILLNLVSCYETINVLISSWSMYIQSCVL